MTSRGSTDLVSTAPTGGVFGGSPFGRTGDVLRGFRLALLVVSLVLTAVTGGAVVVGAGLNATSALAVAMVVALGARWGERARGERQPVGWELPEAAAIVGIALVRTSPVNIAVLLVVGMAWAGLSGSVRRLVAAGMIYGTALVIAAQATPLPGVAPALSLTTVVDLSAMAAAGVFVHAVTVIATRSSRAEAWFRAVVQHASDLIVVADETFRVGYHSPTAARVLSCAPEELDGVNLVDLAHPDDLTELEDFHRRLLEGADNPVGEWRWRCGDGTWTPIEVVGSNRLDDEHVAGLVLNGRDVRERRVLQERLAHEALHDPLTGLGNRTLLIDRLEHALARAQHSGTTAAVVVLDLDNFKTINDSLGQPEGDRLLVEVAERLRPCLRPVDTAVRLGGDEFAVLLEDLDGRRQAERLVERMLERVARPLAIAGTEVFPSASAGIAVASSDSAAHEVLHQGDVAMYSAKAAGKACIRVFEPGMEGSAAERLELTTDLRRAVERGELVLHYQPIVEIDNGHPIGFEALVRWQHPRRGMVSPAEFIPLAEDSGMILAVGRWVLEEAARQLSVWQAQFPPEAALRVGVNLSARQIADAALIDDVAGVVQRHRLPPESLVLEMTESLVMDDTETTRSRLDELKALGVLLSIDDFGTGYSSLAYLRRFPVDSLKIDRSFVAGLGQGLDESALVRAIAKLGQALRLRIVAEGVETPEQLTLLHRLGCHLAQGFHIARPMTAADATVWLSHRLRQEVATSPWSTQSGDQSVAGIRRDAGGGPRSAAPPA